MEADLVQRARDGDESAFDGLIALHREAIFRYAYLIVRDPHAAEDTAQEAILRIYRSIHSFDAAYPFRPWALRITRNVARNQNRTWGRYREVLKRFINLDRRSTDDPETLTHKQQQAALLHQAVSQLRPDYQDVIYARFFMELSVEECAGALDLAEGTVKSRLHRALKALKALIRQRYPQLQQEAVYE